MANVMPPSSANHAVQGVVGNNNDQDVVVHRATVVVPGAVGNANEGGIASNNVNESNSLAQLANAASVSAGAVHPRANDKDGSGIEDGVSTPARKRQKLAEEDIIGDDFSLDDIEVVEKSETMGSGKRKVVSLSVKEILKHQGTRRTAFINQNSFILSNAPCDASKLNPSYPILPIIPASIDN